MGVMNAWAFAAAEIGDNVEFFVGDDDSESSATDSDLRDFYGVPDRGREHLSVRRIGSQQSWGLFQGRRLYAAALQSARTKLAAGQRVWFLTRELGMVPALVRLKQRFPKQLKVLHETHDFHADLKKVEPGGGWTRRRKSWTERLFLPRLDGLICIADAQAELYRAAFPQLPICSVPLGTMTEWTNGSIADRQTRRTVCYVGHLHASKGVHGLLKMIPQFAAANVKLAIFGGYPEQIECLRRDRLPAYLPVGAKEKDCVEFHPFLPPAEMHKMLSSHGSLMLVPLKDTPYNRERTCPVKALDALSHGFPAVASDLPTTRQVLGDAARYSPPGKIKPMAKAAIAILDDAALYQKMAHAAEVRARALAWENRARRIAEFLG